VLIWLSRMDAWTGRAANPVTLKNCRPIRFCHLRSCSWVGKSSTKQSEENIVVISNYTARLALAIGLITGIVGTANAAEPRSALPQLANVTTDLGNNVSAFTYWVDEADGIHVVTTIDAVVGGEAEQDRHAILRFSALILPGQSQVISVPGPVGSQSQALRIRRLGNRFGTVDIEVDRMPEPGPGPNVSGASQLHPDRRSEATPVRDATGPKLPLPRGR
jgi:hypothetical protein